MKFAVPAALGLFKSRMSAAAATLLRRHVRCGMTRTHVTRKGSLPGRVKSEDALRRRKNLGELQYAGQESGKVFCAAELCAA